MNHTYESLKAQGAIIFECIAGSKAYGTDIETSDEDIRYVYIQPLDEILGGEYVPQVNNESNDITGYEIGRFLTLLADGKPNALELISIPEKCVLSQHPVYRHILDNKHLFLTKRLKISLSGAAMSQITKAKGTDKKMNWDRQRTERKTVLDFCYVVLPSGGSMNASKWLEKHKMHQECCGLAKIPNFRDGYALFYDSIAHYQLLNAQDWQEINFGYQGIVRNLETSNEVCLSSIPKNESMAAVLTFNKDGYSEHCKDYREYQDWQKKHNPQRLVDTITHGQSIDGKNLLHCVRYLRMAREIATGQGLQLYRHDREELLNIRRGGRDLQELIDWGKQEIVELNQLFENSGLPESVPPEIVTETVKTMRREFYEI